MSDFTSKIKGAVEKATSAARDMAQDATNMKEKLKDSQAHVEDDEDGSFKMLSEEHQSDECFDSSDKRYDPNAELYDPINDRYDPKEERFEPNEDRYVAASEFDMSPVSQESQKLSGSMERELMDSSMKEQVPHGNGQEAMGRSNVATSQCMSDSHNVEKRP